MKLDKIYLKEWKKFLFVYLNYQFIIPFVLEIVIYIKFLTENEHIRNEGFRSFFGRPEILSPFYLIACTLFILMLLFVYRKDFPPLPKKMGWKQWKHYFKIVLRSYVVIFILIMFVGLYFYFFPWANVETVNEQGINRIPLLTSYFFTIIAAPFVEEVVYRLALFRLFPKKRFLGMICSSLLFALVHVEFSQPPVMFFGEFLRYFPIAIVISYLYYKYNDFYLVWFFHACHNSISLLTIKY